VWSRAIKKNYDIPPKMQSSTRAGEEARIWAFLWADYHTGASSPLSVSRIQKCKVWINRGERSWGRGAQKTTPILSLVNQHWEWKTHFIEWKIHGLWKPAAFLINTYFSHWK